MKRLMVPAIILLSTFSVHALINPSLFINSQNKSKNYKTITCPTTSEQGQDVITKLIQLKSKVSSQANCRPILDQIASHEATMDKYADQYKKITQHKKDQILTPVESNFVRDYSTQTVNYALSLINIVSGNSGCFEKDAKVSGFALASSLIHQATSVASSVAGPYGAPISVMGNLVSGLFSGLNMMIENRSGYDFRDPVQKQVYIASLCTYYDSRKEFEQLLNPREHREDLERVAVAVDEHLDNITETCESCDQIVAMLDQEEYVKDFGTEEEFKSLVEQVKKLEVEANQNSENKRIGSYVITTYNNRKWIRNKLRSFNDSSEVIKATIEQDLLMDHKLDIENFLFTKEAPKFLKAQMKATTQKLKSLDKFYRGSIYPLVSHITRRLYVLENLQSMHQIPYFNELETKKGTLEKIEELLKNDRVAFDQRTLLETQYLRYIDLYDAAYISKGVFNNYCEFFTEAKILSPTILSTCGSSKGVSVEEEINKSTPPARQTRQSSKNNSKNNNARYDSWSDSIDEVIENLLK